MEKQFVEITETTEGSVEPGVSMLILLVNDDVLRELIVPPRATRFELGAMDYNDPNDFPIDFFDAEGWQV